MLFFWDCQVNTEQQPTPAAKKDELPPVKEKPGKESMVTHKTNNESLTENNIDQNQPPENNVKNQQQEESAELQEINAESRVEADNSVPEAMANGSNTDSCGEERPDVTVMFMNALVFAHRNVD
jgi:hypothetical protein